VIIEGPPVRGGLKFVAVCPPPAPLGSSSSPSSIDLVGFGSCTDPATTRRLRAGGCVRCPGRRYSACSFSDRCPRPALGPRGARPIPAHHDGDQPRVRLFALAARMSCVRREARSGFCGRHISGAPGLRRDITTPASASKGMGILGVAFGLGSSWGGLGGLGALRGHSRPGSSRGLSCFNFCSAYASSGILRKARVTRGCSTSGTGRPSANAVAPLMIAWGLSPAAYSANGRAPAVRGGAVRLGERSWRFSRTSGSRRQCAGVSFAKLSRRVGVGRSSSPAGSPWRGGCRGAYLDTAARALRMDDLLAFGTASSPARRD